MVVGLAAAAAFLTLASGQMPVDRDIYAPEKQTTLKGCKCTGECSANHEAFCYTQQVCKVRSPFCKKGLASWLPTSGLGFFDFCTYEAYVAYESKSAAEKEALLWRKVKADTTVGYDYVWPNTTEMYLSDMHVTTDAVSDVFPYPHKKYMHAWGAVAPVRFESFGNHNYTGLFRGAEHGLVRLGMTLPSRSQDGVWFDGVLAGAAVKLLRDGHPSGNLFAIPSVIYQECGSDFFEQYLSTHLLNASVIESGPRLPFTEFAGGKLTQVTLCPSSVGVSNLAYEADTPSDKDRFPWTVELYTDQHSVSIECDDHPASLAKFAELGGNGTELFQVWASPAPYAPREQIGRLVLKDNLTLSKFGDEQLFFKHQVLEEDFQRRPDWLKIVNKTDVCGIHSKDVLPWLPMDIGISDKRPRLAYGCALCGLLANKALCNPPDEDSGGAMLDTDAGVIA